MVSSAATLIGQVEHGQGVLVHAYQVIGGMDELFPDVLQLILTAGRVHLAAGNLFFQIINLSQITNVGDDHGDIIFLIKNRGSW